MTPDNELTRERIEELRQTCSTPGWHKDWHAMCDLAIAGIEAREKQGKARRGHCPECGVYNPDRFGAPSTTEREDRETCGESHEGQGKLDAESGRYTAPSETTDPSKGGLPRTAPTPDTEALVAQIREATGLEWVCDLVAAALAERDERIARLRDCWIEAQSRLGKCFD